jgi:hypothetical protein
LELVSLFYIRLKHDSAGNPAQMPMGAWTHVAVQRAKACRSTARLSTQMVAVPRQPKLDWIEAVAWEMIETSPVGLHHDLARRRMATPQ